MFRIIFKNCIPLATIWAIVIFILCSTPGQYIPTASWLELLSFDKWVHASVFFILSALLVTIAIKKRQSLFTLVVYFFVCVSYGGLLEVMQARWFSNRSADWQDFAANTFGCVIAFLLLNKLRRTYQSFF